MVAELRIILRIILVLEMNFNKVENIRISLHLCPLPGIKVNSSNFQ